MPISKEGEEAVARLRSLIEHCEREGFKWKSTFSVEDVDTTSSGDDWEHGAIAGSAKAEMVRADVVARAMQLDVGNLTVQAQDRSGRGTRVFLDGKPFPCRALRLTFSAREGWNVSLDFFPDRVRKAQEGG